MGTPAKPVEKPKSGLVEKFITWLDGQVFEQEEYVNGLQDIIATCSSMLEDEKPDETSKD